MKDINCITTENVKSKVRTKVLSKVNTVSINEIRYPLLIKLYTTLEDRILSNT